MKTNRYQVIVVGLGAMGSASAYHLAMAGARVLGLDSHHPPHQFGSSHGLTRIIREAYFEHPSYVPLVQRAYELWGDLEKRTDRRLLVKTGGLMIGRPGGVLVSGAIRSAVQHQLIHEVLSSAQIQQRLPAFQPSPDMMAVWEPRAGVLFPEAAIQSHLSLAIKAGAELRFNEPVVGWEAAPGTIRVHTATDIYLADRLVMSVGPWLPSLVNDLKLPLSIERQVMYWFEPRETPDLFRPNTCPVYICEHKPGAFFYGFPDLGDGVKVAAHHQGIFTGPDQVRREVAPEEVTSMREILKTFIPSAEGKLRSCEVCLYTNTPDEHFLLDWHPEHSRVLLVSPCSGHGFKFSSVVGELVTHMVRGNQVPFDLSLFRLNPGRFRAN
jgi:sarcosine oxidase